MMRWVAVVSLVSVVLAPKPAAAQQSDNWQFTLAPLYLWATELDGQMRVGRTTVPVFLEFSDAVDNLGGAFSFHFEARRGRWGLLSDLNFVRLSSESTFTVPALVGQGTRTIEGDFNFDNTLFEIGASYLVSDSARFSVIGGLRTYSLSPKLTFSGANVGVAPIDTSRTSFDGFAGFTFRPQITDKWSFISRGDIGGGESKYTWSGVVGFAYQFNQRTSLEFGYKGLGIDVSGDGVADEVAVTQYDVTHYGPIVGLSLHWGGR